MKFLKTFLFTISLTFLSFGIVTLNGFCASVALDPTLSPSVNSNINQFSSFAITPEYMAIYGPAYIDEINSQLYQNYGWDLETLSWYGEDRFKAYMFGQEVNPINGGQISSTTVNAIASRMQQGISQTALTAQVLFENGYNYFSTAVPQWGNNAKQWILGKIDSATGKISQVGQNVVTKITQEGLSNYLSIYNDMKLSGDILSVDSYKPIYSDTFKLFYPSAHSDIVTCELHFPSNVLCFVYKSGSQYLSGNADIYFVIPEQYVSSGDRAYIQNINGFIIDSHGTYNNLNSAYIYYGSSVSVNGVNYKLGKMYINNMLLYITKPVGNVYPEYNSPSVFVESFLGDSPSPSIAYSYDYSQSWYSALEGQLDRLIGKYVDSITLKRIQDIIDSIPIGYENVGGVDVPVALPDQDIIDALTGEIDDAVTLDSDYAAVFEDSYAEDLDPPDPDPSPNNQGTEVPEDFPITIFSPINDSVGGVFDFVSIFEPLFYIFSFSNGLLGLWLVIPFVILFMFLFKLLK